MDLLAGPFTESKDLVFAGCRLNFITYSGSPSTGSSRTVFTVSRLTVTTLPNQPQNVLRIVNPIRIISNAAALISRKRDIDRSPVRGQRR
jgi:hypothetical protein